MVRIIASLIGAAALFSQVAAAPVVARDGHLAATTTAAAAYETPAPVHESAAVEPTTLHVTPPSHETTTQHAAAPTYTPPAQYGSGHANWGNSYEDCVQQCIAQHGAPPAGTYTAPADPTPTGTPTEGGAGNGATHTVIVAPSQGVLRFVPFALNASVGDTVLFKWGGGPHTVSKSSTLNLCNRTLEDDFFTSGRQNASFQFTQVINDTNPVFYYCSVGEHCARGMFGVLNPPSALGSPDSVGAKMKEWTDANPNLKAAYDEIMAKANGGPAANWGNSISVAGIPEEAHAALAENVLYNRAFFAENPGAIEYGHGAALPDGNELTIPADLSLLLSGTAGNPAGANGAQAGTPPAENTPTSTPTPTGLASTNGAGSLASSGLAVAFVAVVATFFAL